MKFLSLFLIFLVISLMIFPPRAESCLCLCGGDFNKVKTESDLIVFGKIKSRFIFSWKQVSAKIDFAESWLTPEGYKKDYAYLYSSKDSCGVNFNDYHGEVIIFGKKYKDGFLVSACSMPCEFLDLSEKQKKEHLESSIGRP